MTAHQSAGHQLLDEIERVSAKRERWKGYARVSGSAASFAPAILLMTQAIERAKAAIAAGDVIASLQALADLRGYNDED